MILVYIYVYGGVCIVVSKERLNKLERLMKKKERKEREVKREVKKRDRG